QLPQESLSEIFTQALFAEDHPRDHVLALCRFCRVSVAWRNTAITTPQIWTRIPLLKLPPTHFRTWEELSFDITVSYQAGEPVEEIAPLYVKKAEAFAEANSFCRLNIQENGTQGRCQPLLDRLILRSLAIRDWDGRYSNVYADVS
ncbi:MAG: hypothetical protein NXY57DRAFT_1044328, partial [Lentinula lateritia]